MRLETGDGGAGGPASPDAAPADASPQLDLAFGRGADGRTVLARRVHRYPFHVTAPLRDGGTAARVVVQSASGGLYGGEHVVQRILAGEGADARLRFPSATVVHAARATGGTVQRATLVARAGARLAWLPRPAILFPGACLVQCTEVRVAPGAVVLLTDGAMPHDPREERGPSRSLLAETIVRDLDGRLLALDRQRLDDAMLDAARPGGVGSYRAFGTVWILGALEADASAACRARVAADVDGRGGVRAGASALPNGCGLVVRIAARDGGALDAALEGVAAQAGGLGR